MSREQRAEALSLYPCILSVFCIIERRVIQKENQCKVVKGKLVRSDCHMKTIHGRNKEERTEIDTKQSFSFLGDRISCCSEGSEILFHSSLI